MFRIYAEYIDSSDEQQFLLYDSTIENNYILALKLSMEFNQPGTLEMTVTKKNNYFRMNKNKMKIVRVFNNDKEIWRGFLVKEEMDFYTNITLLFEGILSYLNRIVSIYPKNFRDFFNTENLYLPHYPTLKETMDDFFQKSSKGSTKLDPYNFIYNAREQSSIYYDVRYFRNDYDSMKLADTLYDGIQTILLNLIGGFIKPKFTKDSRNWDIEYFYADSLTKTGRVLKKGDQILDFKKEKVLDNTISGVLPIGNDNLLLTNEDSSIFDNLVKNDDEEKYGRFIQIWEDDSVTDTYYLQSYGSSYVHNNDDPEFSMNIDFIDEKLFSDKDYIILPGEYFNYEYSRLIFTENGLDYDDSYGNTTQLQVLCNSVELDLVNPGNSIWKSGAGSYITSNMSNISSRNNYLSTGFDFDADYVN